jgi:hypothetical protein
LEPQKGDMPDQWNLIRKSPPLCADCEHFEMNTGLSGLTVIDVDIKMISMEYNILDSMVLIWMITIRFKHLHHLVVFTIISGLIQIQELHERLRN